MICNLNINVFCNYILFTRHKFYRKYLYRLVYMERHLSVITLNYVYDMQVQRIDTRGRGGFKI